MGALSIYDPDPIQVTSGSSPGANMATTTSIVEQRESPEIEAMRLGLIQSARELAERGGMYAGVPSQRILQIPDSPLEAGVYDYLADPTTFREGIGGYLPMLTRAGEAVGRGITGVQAGRTALAPAYATLLGSAGRFQDTVYDPAADVARYTDPYEDLVVEKAMEDLRREGDLAQRNLASQAVGAGAFGGSRFGLERQELARNLAEAQADAALRLRSAGYGQALAASRQDVDARQARAAQAFAEQQRRQQALAGQYATLASTQAGFGAQEAGLGGQQAALAQQMQGLGIQGLGVRQAAGQVQRALEQQQAHVLHQEALRNALEPYGRLGWVSDIYKGIPTTQSSFSAASSPEPRGPSGLQTFGNLAMGLGGLGMAGKNLGLFGPG